MKKTFILIFIITVLSACTQSEYMVRSDHAPDIDFENYETYYFASRAMSPNTDDFINDADLKTEIRENIKYEMTAKGYDHTENDPDLLINFRIFEDEVEIVGYTQEEIEQYWGTQDIIDIDNMKTYNLDPGTLMIDIMDNETKQLIWTGYASGIIEDDAFDKSEEALAAAVSKIFADYDYRANEL